MQGKKEKRIWKRTGIAAAAIAVCLVVMAGTAWARYQLSQAYGMQYEAKSNASVYLGQGIDASGNFVSGQSEWTQSEGLSTLEFVVSNGSDTSSYNADPQKVFIRLYSSVGCDLSGATILLHIDDETYYWGTVRQIVENSPVYKTFGSGWYVEFLDDAGNELSWVLDGGRFSWLSARLEIWNGELTDVTQFRLQVTGDKSIRE